MTMLELDLMAAIKYEFYFTEDRLVFFLLLKRKENDEKTVVFFLLLNMIHTSETVYIYINNYIYIYVTANLRN